METLSCGDCYFTVQKWLLPIY